MENIHAIVLEEVRNHPGIKATELVIKVLQRVDNREYITFQDYDFVIGSLITMGDIREEEYSEPEMPWRVKSRYFIVNGAKS